MVLLVCPPPRVLCVLNLDLTLDKNKFKDNKDPFSRPQGTWILNSGLGFVWFFGGIQCKEVNIFQSSGTAGASDVSQAIVPKQ